MIQLSLMKIPKMVTIDKLAQMIARGFEDQEKRFTHTLNEILQSLNERMDFLESKLDFLESKLDGINNRLDDLALNRATRDEVYTLNKRITRIENKLGFKT